jgi:hypothetical protein
MRKRDVCMGKAGALENLSLEDVGVLEELEEEYSRRGSYRRIFPQVLCTSKAGTVRGVGGVCDHKAPAAAFPAGTFVPGKQALSVFANVS